jgi:hypothetical protein
MDCEPDFQVSVREELGMKRGNIYRAEAADHDSTYTDDDEEYVVKSIDSESDRRPSAAENEVLIVYACQDTDTIEQGELTDDTLVGHVKDRPTPAKMSTDPSTDDLIEKWENEGGF